MSAVASVLGLAALRGALRTRSHWSSSYTSVRKFRSSRIAATDKLKASEAQPPAIQSARRQEQEEPAHTLQENEFTFDPDLERFHDGLSLEESIASLNPTDRAEYDKVTAASEGLMNTAFSRFAAQDEPDTEEVENFVSGFLSDDEEDPAGIGPDEVYKGDDMTPLGHGELDQHREVREYARIAAWDMPLLSSESPPCGQQPRLTTDENWPNLSSFPQLNRFVSATPTTWERTIRLRRKWSWNSVQRIYR